MTGVLRSLRHSFVREVFPRNISGLPDSPCKIFELKLELCSDSLPRKKSMDFGGS